MKLNDKITDARINQYINGELSGEILTAFETKLETDKDFRNEVEMHQEIDTVLMQNYLDLDDEVRAKEKEKLQPIFDEINEKYFKVQKEKQSGKLGFANFNEAPILDFKVRSYAIIRRLLPFALTAAASFMLFIFNPFFDKLSFVELADKYFEPYEKENLTSRAEIDSVFFPLPYTLAEVKAIEKICTENNIELACIYLTAGVDTLKYLDSRICIIHYATHGVYGTDIDWSNRLNMLENSSIEPAEDCNQFNGFSPSFSSIDTTYKDNLRHRTYAFKSIIYPKQILNKVSMYPY